jgi:hypothetical protein
MERGIHAHRLGAAVDARTAGGVTPLFVARSAGVARALLRAGADPTKVSPFSFQGGQRTVFFLFLFLFFF